MSPDPPTEMCCHFTVRVHGPLPAKSGNAPKLVQVQACNVPLYTNTLFLYPHPRTVTPFSAFLHLPRIRWVTWLNTSLLVVVTIEEILTIAIVLRYYCDTIAIVVIILSIEFSAPQASSGSMACILKHGGAYLTAILAGAIFHFN